MYKRQAIDTERQNPTVPIHKTLLGSVDDRWEGLWSDLFREDVRTGSITGWEPRRYNQTNFNLGNPVEVQAWSTVLLGVAAPQREDRKRAFLLPTCSSKTHGLEIQLLEPDLKWIAMTVREATMRIAINGIVIPQKRLKSSWQTNQRLNLRETQLNTWINVQEQVPRAENYTITLCTAADPVDEEIEHFEHFVGVMVPTSRSGPTKLTPCPCTDTPGLEGPSISWLCCT